MIICTTCGAQNPDRQILCQACRQALPANAPVAAPAPPAPLPAATYYTPPASYPASPPLPYNSAPAAPRSYPAQTVPTAYYTPPAAGSAPSQAGIGFPPAAPPTYNTAPPTIAPPAVAVPRRSAGRRGFAVRLLGVAVLLVIGVVVYLNLSHGALVGRWERTGSATLPTPTPFPTTTTNGETAQAFSNALGQLLTGLYCTPPTVLEFRADGTVSVNDSFAIPGLPPVKYEIDGDHVRFVSPYITSQTYRFSVSGTRLMLQPDGCPESYYDKK